MIICFCKNLTERQIQELIQNGASSLDDIINCCSACLDCGQCKEDIIKILEKRDDNVLSKTRV